MRKNKSFAMAPYLLLRSISTVLLISCIAVKGVYPSQMHRRGWTAEYIEETCPPCELLFSKLQKTGRHGKLAQDIRVQIRGEAKSGTGFMFFWATATFFHTCNYLRELFGENTCQVDFHRADESDNQVLARYSNRSMTFEPALGGSDARCSCDAIDRVSIVVSKVSKHSLPVKDSCAFSHRGGIALGGFKAKNDKNEACIFADGTPVKHNDDLWRCMHEADCEITDDWLQMAVFRDPRPVVVSTFFYLEVHGGRDLGDFEEFVMRELPILCQWVAVRYILFAGFLDAQSMRFWYHDAIENPLAWHYHWFYRVGLQLPRHIVEATAQAAAADDLGFTHKGIDLHPGEKVKTETTVRRFEDEVSPDVLEIADAVLRQWLPPVLLEKVGIMP